MQCFFRGCKKDTGLNLWPLEPSIWNLQSSQYLVLLSFSVCSPPDLVWHISSKHPTCKPICGTCGTIVSKPAQVMIRKKRAKSAAIPDCGRGRCSFAPLVEVRRNHQLLELPSSTLPYTALWASTLPLPQYTISLLSSTAHCSAHYTCGPEHLGVHTTFATIYKSVLLQITSVMI